VAAKEYPVPLYQAKMKRLRISAIPPPPTIQSSRLSFE
jgi:hypothetical protein